MSDAVKKDKKKGPLPSTLLNMFIVLTAICTICSAILAYTFNSTKDQIAVVGIQKTQKAFLDVITGFDNNPLDTKVSSTADPLVNVYTAKQGDKLLGWAVESYSDKGYGGRIRIMFGISADGALQGIQVLSHTETPGLGTKMTSRLFQKQFFGKNINEAVAVKKDGGTIDAISAATISSRAFCDAVTRAFVAIKEIRL